MTENDDGGIYQLIYRSRCMLTGSDAFIENEVNAILKQSEANNLRDGVTGALMFAALMFVQVLEGSRTDIEQTFERICCDLRHMNVELMSLSSVPARTFNTWHLHRVPADATLEALFHPFGPSAMAEGRSKPNSIADAVAQMAVLAATVSQSAADQPGPRRLEH